MVLLAEKPIDRKVWDWENRSVSASDINRQIWTMMPRLGTVSRSYLLFKRVTDIFISLAGLIACLPLLVLAGVAIKLTSSGPIIFKQQRAGLMGRPFTMYKLRTMVRHMDDETILFQKEGFNGPAFKLKNDPRITRVGGMLRKTSIDELPQLMNVLLGDMALVGPRPLPLEQVRLNLLEELARLSVKPGLTGLWQVSGRADIPYAEWLAMDYYYVQHRSLWLDLLILLKTIPAVLSCKGAY